MTIPVDPNNPNVDPNPNEQELEARKVAERFWADLYALVTPTIGACNRTNMKVVAALVSAAIDLAKGFGVKRENFMRFVTNLWGKD